MQTLQSILDGSLAVIHFNQKYFLLLIATNNKLLAVIFTINKLQAIGVLQQVLIYSDV